MRAVGLQVLTDDIKARHPGTTIWGVGDEAHKGSKSGHNEDDTPGSKPEQEDPDNKPEHRAIDVMIGPKFTVADAWALVVALVTIQANRDRLIYVIFNRKIWRKANGWREEVYTGSDSHTDHVHVSGDWPSDEIRDHWVLSSGGATTTTGGAGVSNFTIQISGSPTIYLSDGFKYRGVTSWDAFLTMRDVFKWPFILVPSLAELRVRAGVTVEESTPAAILSDAQVARIEAAAKAGAVGGAGGIDLDALRAILDDESISEDEIAERFGANA